MFCPSCRDEFRAGFERCARCDVDLVLDLTQLEPGPAEPKAPLLRPPVAMVDFCGFFTMVDAKHAREQVRRRQIPTEIVLREPPDADWDAPPQDEFWLRVDASRVKEVQAVIESLDGEDPPAAGGTFACSDCGHDVAEEESFCPKCGARFD